MAEIPDYQTLMLPVLQAASTGETTVAKVVEQVARQFELTPEQLEEVLPSGNQAIISNRVHWAKFYMTRAGVLEMVRRGVFRASNRGLEILAKKPTRIDNQLLSQFPEFRQFREQNRTESASPVKPSVDVQKHSLPEIIQHDDSPDERIEKALREIDTGLRDELSDRLFQLEPQSVRASYFEQLVMKLLFAMGYGGVSSKAAIHLGGRGDGGVDGVIHLDALGIDRVLPSSKVLRLRVQHFT